MSVLDINPIPVSEEYLLSKGFYRCSCFTTELIIWYEYRVGRKIALSVSLQQNLVVYQVDKNLSNKWIEILDTKHIDILIEHVHKLYDNW